MKAQLKIFLALTAIFFTASIFPIAQAESLITSYEGAENLYPTLTDVHPSLPTGVLRSAEGEVFQLSSRYVLTKSSFSMKIYAGSPDVYLVSRLYEVNSTERIWGINYTATGSPLASSNLIHSSALTGSSAWIDFTFTDGFIMEANHPYAIDVEVYSAVLIDGTNDVVAVARMTANYNGNLFRHQLGSWSTYSIYPSGDLLFRIYGN